MKALICIWFLLIKANLVSQIGVTENQLQITSSQDLLTADTSVVYSYIEVRETDSLIAYIILLERLHFKSFSYSGGIRKRFPYYKEIKSELSDVIISGKNLKNIPSFIKYGSLSNLMIEASGYKIDFDLVKCNHLTKLSLYTKNTYEKLDQICQLENLETLIIDEMSEKVLYDVGCLKNLKKLSFLGISLTLDHLNELLIFQNLNELYLGNKISYDFINRHLSFFMKYKYVKFWDFRGTSEQEKDLREKLGEIWK